MPATLFTSSDPPLGFGIGKQEALFYNRTGTTRAIGDLLLVDLLLTDGDTTTFQEGDDASAFANLVDGAATDRDVGIFVACQEAPIDNELSLCTMWGLRVQVQVDNNTAGTISDGEELWAPDAAPLDAVHANTSPVSGARRLGFLDKDESLATATAAVKRLGVFSGFRPFGVHFL